MGGLLSFGFRRFAALSAALLPFLVVGCEEDPVAELLKGEGTDAGSAGIYEVTRRPDGTIEIGLYGVKGVSQYQIVEFETDDVSGDMTETRVLRRVRHVPGQLEYRLETFDIPFGMNFCYQARAEMADNKKVKDLGVVGCLQDNSAWHFKGVQKAQVDAAGRVVLAWDRIPSDGVTYEIFSKLGDAAAVSDRPMARITDSADYIDEVGENVFPRCYRVRASHQRFSAKDANEKEICLDLETYRSEMLSSPDAERPVFAGLKSISILKSQGGVVDGLLSAVGLKKSYTVQLTWDPATDNLTRPGRMSYHVYRVRTGSRGELNYREPLAVTDQGELAFTDDSIEERMSYEYLVRAVDERGNMDVNEVWKELPLDFEPPVFDGAVSAISERQSNSVQVRVSWARAFDNKTDPINIEYRIYRRPKGEPEFDLSLPLATRTGVASESISYVDTSVVRGGTYQYLVRAVDKDGNEDTNESVVEITASGLAPAFAGLKSATRKGSSVELRWTGATDDDSSQSEITYTVYRSEDDQFGPTKILSVTEPGTTVFEDTSADVDTTYYYLVRATDRNGFEDENTETKTLTANQAPTWPINTNRNGPGPEWVGLKDGKLGWDKTEGGVSLQWTYAADDYSSPEGITYTIYRNDRPTGFDFSRHLAKVPGVAGAAQLTYVDSTDHATGRGYYYLIKATDEFGAISASSSVVQLPANEKPAEPRNPSARQIPGTQQAEITWNPAEDDRTSREEMRYTLYRFVDGTTPVYEPANEIASVDGSKALSVVDAQGAASSENYRWSIVATDSYGLKSIATLPFGLAANTPPREGGIISVERASGLKVTVKWTQSIDAEQNVLTYRVYAQEVPTTTTAGTDGLIANAAMIDGLFFPANEKQTIFGAVDVITFGDFPVDKAYIFGVRAYDDKGLTDGNRKVILLRSNPAPQFAGVATAQLLTANGNVRLTWIPATDDVPSSQIDYRVYKLEDSRATAPAADILQFGVLTGTSGAGVTSYVDEVVNPTTYTHYLVRALDPMNLEDANTVVKSVPPDSLPPVFLGIKTATMDGRRITLGWDDATDTRTSATDMVYRVYESTSPVLADLLATAPVAQVINGNRTYSRTPPNNLTHYYVVRAFDKAGNSDGNEMVRNTVDEIPPVFAGMVAAFPITNSSVQVFWTGIPNEDVFQIKIYSTDNTLEPIAAVNARDNNGNWINSYTITGLSTATEYTFLARASDGAGNEEKNTNSQTVTTLASQPPVFAGLQEAVVAPGTDGLTKVDLTWSEASGASHYRIFRIPGTSELGTEFDFNHDTCQGNWNSPSLPGCLQIDAENVTSYRVQNLNKDTTYSFIVRALNLANGFVVGEEKNRRIRSVTTLTERAPTFAGAASAVPAPGDAGLSSIVVKWDRPSADGVWDGFTVLYKDFSAYPITQTTFPVPDNFASDPGLMTYTVGDVDAGEAIIGSLLYGRRYCFTVVTRYQPIPTRRSAPENPGGYKCTAPNAQPPQFNGVKAQVIKGLGAQAFTQFTVEWDAAIGSFTRYEVSWSTVDDYVDADNTGSFYQSAFTRASVATRSQTSYTITGLEPNKTYHVRVRAVFEMPAESVFLKAGSGPVTQNTTTPVIPNGDGVLTVEQISDEEVEVRWNAPNNGGLYDRYYLFRASGSGADSTVVSQTDPNLGNVPPYQASPFVTVPSTAAAFQSRTYVNTGVLPNTRYCYMVKAAYGGVEGFVGSPNAKVGCVDVEISPPEFNGIVTLKAPNSPSGFSSLVATWEEAVGNFTKYQYAVLTAPGDTPVWLDINGGRDTTSVTIVGLNPNTIYYVRVRAVYSKLGTNYTAGETAQLQAVTTPLSPQHAGLEPIAFLTNPGEVEISWDLPNANPDIGGVYDRFLVWRYTNGSATDIMDEIEALTSPEFDSISPGVITQAEATSGVYHFTEVTNPATTKITYTGANKLTENIQTCFLVRAAYRSGNNFLMSSNQTVRCVTPTASAPLFGGIKTLENIPNTVNGFKSLKATWNPAQGNFTRYEVVLSTVSGSDAWTPRAAVVTDISESFRFLYNRDGEVSGPATALQAHTTYYGRVRALYQGADSTIYSAGESTEIARKVLPNVPTGDGILNATATKVPGQLASAEIVLKGNVPGFWDKVFIWREVHDDQGSAYNAVLAKAAATADGKAFVSAPNITVLRPSSGSTANITYNDEGIAVGKYNCYIARAGYNTPPNFLLSVTPQIPVCVRPQYNPISFAGVSTAGSEVCDVQAPGSNDPCDSEERWPYTGNSKIRLRLESAPAGDIDLFDVYMGTSPVAATLLSQTPFQSILKGDADHDPDDGDVYLHVGGDPRLHVPPGRLYFLVRARCLGCAFVDNNTNVSNPVEAKRPYTLTRFDMVKDEGVQPISSSTSAYGGLEDRPNTGALGTSGFADLTGANDYLKSTNPIDFAPKPGRTFGMKFEFLTGTNNQNVEGSAVFAADVGNRMPYWRDTGAGYEMLEGSILGAPGASAVYDRRTKKCLFIGGYAGNGINRSDGPYRDWMNSWYTNNRWNAQRFQAWDGQNFGEIRTRGPSPLPRSMPVTAYNPSTGNVMLFGGWDQDAPQKLRADTWEWDGQSWKLISAGPTDNQVQSNQPGRYGDGVMAFDPFRQQMVMVGGRWKIPSTEDPDADRSRVTRTGQGNNDNLEVLRDVRNQNMWHFFPDATGALNWQTTTPLPSGFPNGYPAALVAVPMSAGAGIAGLYYLAAQWDWWEHTSQTHNIWKWDGNSWQEIIDSRLTSRRPWAQLFADWDPVKKKIVMTFGRGNEETEQFMYEWDPAQAQLGAAAWTQHQLTSAPYVKYGQSACYDVDRREFVITGGSPWYDTNRQLTKPSVTYQDIFTFSTATNAWKKIDLKYDHSSQGMYQKHEGLRGVHATAVEWSPGWWWNWTSAYVNWIFKDGFWNRINIDSAKKYRWWDQPGVNYYGDHKLAESSTAPGTGHTYRIWKSRHHNSTNDNAITGYGQPEKVMIFDGTGWTSKPVQSSTHQFHSRFCPDVNVTNYANHPYSYPNFRLDWESVTTPWGLFSATYDTYAYWPYNFYPTTNPVCSAGQNWRYAKSPFLMLVENGTGGFDSMEVLETTNSRWGTVPTHANGIKYQFCQVPANQVRSEFMTRTPYMQFDPSSGKIWLFGYRDGDWSRFNRDIQAISYNATSQCFMVENFTAAFDSTGWTQVSLYNWRMDYWGYDPERNVISVFGKHGVSSTLRDAGTNGVIWELDLNAREWNERILPEEYRKWSALQGNRLRVAPLPGKPGEYLVNGVIELHTGRHLSEGYILKITNSEIKMRPILPRFGLTVGDDGVSGYLSVPGDPGEADIVYGGEQLYSGKRLIAPNLVGENDLWVVFKNTTYDVYLNGSLVVSNQPWAGANSSLYMMDFILGARYGSYYFHDDFGQSGFKGIGNTNVRIDWVKVFDRELNSTERDFWESADDNPAPAP